MDIEKACEILGLEAGDSLEEIKRKYHRLASELHPDTEKYKKTESDITIAEVNAAYEFLMKQGGFTQLEDYLKKKKQGKISAKHEKVSEKWDALENPGAYVEREIYQYAEDQEGNPIGIYRVATGKYYWNPEAEDFSLFLRSMISAVDGLIGELEEKQGAPFEEEPKFEAKKELIYLLAGQYTDLESGLEVFSKKDLVDSNGIYTFYLSAMMETDKNVNWRRRTLDIGERLYPLKLANHRLYVGKKDGVILGYLSFSDDRLYYVLIPMFENREVQVKIEIADERKKNGRGAVFFPLHLWIRKIKKEYSVQESVNRKIEQILSQFGRK